MQWQHKISAFATPPRGNFNPNLVVDIKSRNNRNVSVRSPVASIGFSRRSEGFARFGTPHIRTHDVLSLNIPTNGNTTNVIHITATLITDTTELCQFVDEPLSSELLNSMAMNFYYSKTNELTFITIYQRPCRSWHILDIKAIGAIEAISILKPIFESSSILKIVYDAHEISYQMSLLNSTIDWNRIWDVQLVVEYKGSHKDRLKTLTQCMDPENGETTGNKSWLHRPISKYSLELVIKQGRFLRAEYKRATTLLTKLERNLIYDATLIRIAAAVRNSGIRSVWFNSNDGFQSAELLLANEDTAIHPYLPKLVESKEEVQKLLNLFPNRFRTASILQDSEELSTATNIVFDKGRSAYISLDNDCTPRQLLVPTKINTSANTVSDEENIAASIVTEADLNEIVSLLGGPSSFGNDNSAGLDECLHRISVLRNRSHKIIGLTMRVGRAFQGQSDCIRDLLQASSATQSILVVGHPGTGKTTLLRDISRNLSQKQNICIVDTFNEIGGDGDIPHPHIGAARRIMVSNINHQHNVIVECAQNHSISTIVIDEIGGKKDVEAIRTVKNRGVAIIASAHGDLFSLLQNAELNTLVGGVTSVSLGDNIAVWNSHQLSKYRLKRKGTPIFDIIIELQRPNECVIIHDVSKVVDGILERERVFSEKRSRDQHTGGILIDQAIFVDGYTKNEGIVEVD